MHECACIQDERPEFSHRHGEVTAAARQRSVGGRARVPVVEISHHANLAGEQIRVHILCI